MDNQNGSISFILRFQNAPLLQNVKVLDFLNVPVVLSKPQTIEGHTYFSETPIGLISNFTVFRDGIAFNSNIWLQFTEGIDLTTYKTEAEFTDSDEPQLQAFMIVPQAQTEGETGVISDTTEPKEDEKVKEAKEDKEVEMPPVAKPKKKTAKKDKKGE